MSMDQLMALVPIEAATTLSTTTSKGRRSRWERSNIPSHGKSRFGPKDDKPYLPPPFVDLPPGLTPLQLDQFLREQRLDELTGKLERGELEFGDPDIRPPSPPPAYDKNGNRTNTRDVRVRNAMVSEHQRLLEYMASTVVGFIPPSDYKPVKKIRRIIIPQEKFPEYNFMGLIIGPRGCNHKRLESESGAQISIRGRGTQKEGKKTDHQTEEEAAMPQHIHIAADTEESLDKAVALIEPLLNPHHPAHEEFKKKGLEQLALVNGVTLSKFENRCSVCGAVGHLSWECPDTDFQSFQRADVKCALCGDKGHVTMDCKLAKGLSGEQLAEIEKKAQSASKSTSVSIPPPPTNITRPDSAKIDMEYSQMMSELTGRPNPNQSGTNPHAHNNHNTGSFSGNLNMFDTATTGHSTNVPNTKFSATVYMGRSATIPPPPHSMHTNMVDPSSMLSFGQDYSAYYNTYAGANMYNPYAPVTAATAAATTQQAAMWNGMDINALANYYNSFLTTTANGGGVMSQQHIDQMTQMMTAMYNPNAMTTMMMNFAAAAAATNPTTSSTTVASTPSASGAMSTDSTTTATGILPASTAVLTTSNLASTGGILTTTLPSPTITPPSVPVSSTGVAEQTDFVPPPPDEDGPQPPVDVPQPPNPPEAEDIPPWERN